MRTINFIVVHCTATPQTATIESIRNYWKNILKWKSPGYHFIIDPKGTIYQLQKVELIANGVKGYNHNSIHISYIGGVDEKGNPKDNRNIEQKLALENILQQLKNTFPHAEILGHRDFKNVNKACPSFNAKKEYSNIMYEMI
jgi:N-acetylmuramoyl-L-alanine amidase